MEKKYHLIVMFINMIIFYFRKGDDKMNFFDMYEEVYPKKVKEKKQEEIKPEEKEIEPEEEKEIEPEEKEIELEEEKESEE